MGMCFFVVFFMCFFFFFQAEDGIRDIGVTGVQTCALPISRLVEWIKILKRLWTEDEVTFEGQYWQFSGVTIDPKPVRRSGRGRVGEEGRSRWVPDYLKKKKKETATTKTWKSAPKHRATSNV